MTGKLNARPEPQPARRHVSCRNVDPACGRKDRESRWKRHRKEWRIYLRPEPVQE